MKKMISVRNFVCVFLMLASAFATTGCGEEQNIREEAIARQKGTVVELPDMPADARPATVDINDLNFWTEGKYFYVVGLVDDRSNKWSRIWVKLQITDADGEVLKFDGDKEIVVPTFSDGVPPRGRTSFFAGFPLHQFNGTPAKAQIANAYFVEVDPGPILVVTEFTGVKLMTPAPGDSVSTIEQGWTMGGYVENPLPQFPCNNLRGEVLVYGSDERLYLSKLVISDGEKPSLMMEKTGPILPGEKRRIGTSVLYAQAPRILDSIKIGRVELHPFDAKPFRK